MNEALKITGGIQRVRVTRWATNEAPAEYDRANPQAHPDCLEVFEIQEDGSRKVIYRRADQCH